MTARLGPRQHVLGGGRSAPYVCLQVNTTAPPGRDWGASRICARVYDKQSDFRLTMQSLLHPGVSA